MGYLVGGKYCAILKGNILVILIKIILWHLSEFFTKVRESKFLGNLLALLYWMYNLSTYI